jgi:primosomal protein N' (replication factor Y)
VPFSPIRTEHLLAVAVPVPGLGLLTYRVSGRMEAPPKGARVQVPLGTRTVTGCVVGPADVTEPAQGSIKEVVSVVDDQPFLPPAVVDLALWMAEYYAAGPGDTLVSAMPPAARRAEDRPFRMRRVVELVERDAGSVRGPRQRQAVELLASRPDGMPVAELGRAGVSAATLQRLAGVGVVRVRDEVDERDPFAGEAGRRGDWSLRAPAGAAPALTEEQALALTRLVERADEHQFRVALLHGVTGSGKTEVYLRLAEHVIRHGGRVLVLVPEIALTPALVGQFRHRSGSRVAVQHSGLSDGERHDQWHRIRRGDVDIVIGTRSAILAPVDRLSLIVVDEEHEPSYKQEETPRYHARDVAVMRGQMERALVVLGSATPSLESAANALSGRYERIELSRRVLGRPMADVRIVDMRREIAASGRIATFSTVLLQALEDRLRRGQQSLVLLNRRGYATVVFCRQCGRSMECPHCSVYLTLHRAARLLRCHYCNHATRVPKHCVACGGEYLEHSGFGTERLEADLRQTFASARIGRLDRDTARRRGAIARLLAAVAGREIDILVGTQMIAKGHDFPGVTLVGVVSADVGLGMADFRASERTFQLLTQVVGRAGRGETAGEAVVQTLYPDHYSVRTAARQDYQAFFAREMEFRTAMHYPPDTALINVIVKGSSIEAAMNDAGDLAGRIRATAVGRVIGPAPAALARVRKEYRAQFFLKGRRRRAMREAVLAALASRADLRKRITVDIDPVTVT